MSAWYKSLLERELPLEISAMAELAATMCGVNLAFIGFENKNVWQLTWPQGMLPVKSNQLFHFCDSVLEHGDKLFIANSDLVMGQTSEFGLLAGIRLFINRDYPVGVLCVASPDKLVLSDAQKKSLIQLGIQTSIAIKMWFDNEKLRSDKASLMDKVAHTSTLYSNQETKETLTDSEMRLNLVLAGINDGWWDWDLVGEQLYYSPKWWSMLGYEPNELPATPDLWRDLLHPDDEQDVLDVHENYIEKGADTYEVEFRLQHKDGHYVPVLSRGYISRNKEGNPIRLSGSNMDMTEIKKAKEALGETMDRIKSVADNLPNGVIFQYVLHPDGTREVPYMSSGAKNMFGYEAEEIIAKPALVFGLIHPDLEEMSEAIGHSSNHLTDFDLQYQIDCNGQIKWAHTRSKPKRLPNGATRWDGLTVDITEQKMASELVKKTKRELQSILVTIPDLLFRFDKDYRYTYCHATTPEDLVVPVERLLHSKMDDFLPPELVVKTKNAIQNAHQSGRVEVFEYDLEIPKRGQEWFEARIVSTNQDEALCIIRNITERRRAEDALQKSQSNLRTVFDNTEVGYCLFDHDLFLVSFNKPAQNFATAEFVRPLELGVQFFDYFPDASKAPAKQVLYAVLEGQTFQYDRLFPKQNEDDKWYNIKYSPVASLEGKVTGVVMAIENISDRKKNEIALTKSFELVTDQNKRLLNFSYIVSHNLRSHTSNIKSILALLQYAESDEDRNEMLQMLEGVSNTLSETIHNLNDVVSIQTNLNHVVQPLKLRHFIEKAQVVLADQVAVKNATIINEVEEGVMVDYNPAYLESIVLNFLSNAIKYSHPGRPPVVTLRCYQAEQQTVLEIADNGIGIDMKLHGDKLFGMYKTFNGNVDAKGIGLFITKNQIEAMGGKVEAQSKVDIGTTFCVYFK
jgi:PAS domain S-box-containing protein